MDENREIPYLLTDLGLQATEHVMSPNRRGFKLIIGCKGLDYLLDESPN